MGNYELPIIKLQKIRTHIYAMHIMEKENAYIAVSSCTLTSINSNMCS